MTKQLILSGSILAADFANLKQDIDKALAAGIDYIHFDTMDHHFVPNLSFGAVVCESLRKAGVTAPIDVHLMVTNPEKYIEPFAKAGADLLIFHREVVDDLMMMINRIKETGMEAGIAFNPQTDFDLAPEIVRELGLILIMSVQPGFAGQKFMPAAVEKIKKARRLITDTKSSAFLAVDGGINTETIHTVCEAGVDFVVVGSALFHTKDYAATVQQLRSKA